MISNMDSLNWIVSSILYVIAISYILFFLFFFLVKYKKQKINPFTIRKISTYIILLSIALIQKFLGSLENIFIIRPLTFSTLTIFIVGLLYGPLEGLFYGFILDTLSFLFFSLPLGFIYQPLFAFGSWIIGLNAGLLGIYFKSLDKRDPLFIEKWLSIITTQIAIVLFFMTAFLLPYFVPYTKLGLSSKNQLYTYFSFATFAFVAFEAFSIYLTLKKKSTDFIKISWLFLLILVQAAIFELVFNSVALWNVYKLPISVSVIKGVFISTYELPLQTIFVFYVYKFIKIAFANSRLKEEYN